MNHAADALSRAYCAAAGTDGLSSLSKLHENLCHPGVTRLHHYCKQKNLPFSLEDIRDVCSQCRTCAEYKPLFFKPDKQTLIKATKPMERISVDFKGPIQSDNEKKYLFVAVFFFLSDAAHDYFSSNLDTHTTGCTAKH